MFSSLQGGSVTRPENSDLPWPALADGTDIKAAAFEALTFSDGDCGPGTHASFTGTATINGEPGKPFRAEADDCGEPGVGSDSFSIAVLEPDGYSNSGTLMGGNIQVHR